MTLNSTATRHLLTTILVAALLMIVSGDAAAGVITLRDAAVKRGPIVTLADLADLTGDDAVALGTLVVPATGGQVSMEQVRRLLTEKNVHWGRMTLRGAAVVSLTAAAAKPVIEEAAAATEADAASPAFANPTPPITTPQAADPASQTLRQRLVAWMAQLSGADESDLRVTFENENEALLDVSVGSARYEFESLSRDSLGRMPVVIRRYEAGRIAATHRLLTHLERKQTVVVARKPLSRGQTVTESDVELKSMYVATAARPAASDTAAVIGSRIDAPLRPGAIVFTGDLRGAAVVKRGQMVTVRCISGGLVLKTVGRAMEDGEIGQTIKVQNDRDAQRPVFQARVTGVQEALVMLDEQPAEATANAAKETGK